MNQNENNDGEATPDVGAQHVARVYAEALLNAAQKQNQGNEVLEEFDSLIHDVFPANPHIEAFLSSGAIGHDRKTPVIQAIFQGRASESFINFLLVVNKHDRLDLLRPILRAAHELGDERAHRVQVQVRTAAPLPDDQRERLLQGLRQSFHLEPILQTKVDPELLGGLIVQVGDWQFDGSVRNQIETIRNELIESSSHEIQSRRDRFSN